MGHLRSRDGRRIIETWTAREATLLCRALRLPLAQFARHVRVTTRTVEAWATKGEHRVVHTQTQAHLDAALLTADEDAIARFWSSVDRYTTTERDAAIVVAQAIASGCRTIAAAIRDTDPTAGDR